MKKRQLLIPFILTTLLLTGCGTTQQKAKNHVHQENSQQQKIAKSKGKQPKTKLEKKLITKPKRMAKINYKRPSENRPYPKQLKKTDIIKVSIKNQRVYIIRDGHIIYTMYASTGSNDRTPKGTFRIQPQRGNYFYSQKEHEGAKYYTSWKDDGVYLFHATPNNKKKHIIKPVAKKLGKEPSSHGCIHLTIPDAKYIENNAKVGTKVIIK